MSIYLNSFRHKKLALLCLELESSLRSFAATCSFLPDITHTVRASRFVFVSQHHPPASFRRSYLQSYHGIQSGELCILKTKNHQCPDRNRLVKQVVKRWFDFLGVVSLIPTRLILRETAAARRKEGMGVIAKVLSPYIFSLSLWSFGSWRMDSHSIDHMQLACGCRIGINLVPSKHCRRLGNQYF